MCDFCELTNKRNGNSIWLEKDEGEPFKLCVNDCMDDSATVFSYIYYCPWCGRKLDEE